MTNRSYLTPAQEMFLNQTITNHWPKVLSNTILSNASLYETLEARILEKNIIDDFIEKSATQPYVGAVKEYIAREIQRRKGGCIDKVLEQIPAKDFEVLISKFQAHKPSFKLVGEPGFCRAVRYYVPQIGMKLAG